MSSQIAKLEESLGTKLFQRRPFALSQQLRALALSDFPPAVVGVAWSGKLSDIARQLLAELDTEAETQRARIEKKRIAIRGDFF